MPVRKLQHNQFTWFDLSAPTLRELADISQELNLSPLAQETLKKPIRFPHIEHYGEHLLLVIQIPTAIPERRDVRNVGLDFLIGKNFLLTHHFDTLPFLEKLTESISQEKERSSEQDTGHLLYLILEEAFKKIFEGLEGLEDVIEAVEEGLFEGREREMVAEISIAHRNVIDFRRALSPARPVWEALLSEGREFFSPKTLPYLRRITATLRRIDNLLGAHMETISALEQTNQAILSSRINEIVKVLTVITATAIPFTVIGALYGMNVPLPSFGSGDFWILVGLMTILSAAMFTFVRLRRWI